MMSSVDPIAPKLRVAQAVSALNAHDRDGAASIIADLVEQDAALGSTWSAVSRLASVMGETSLALKSAERLTRVPNAGLGSRLAHGALLIQSGRASAARQLAESIISDHADHAAAWHFIASCRAVLGDVDHAVSDFRQAVDRATDPSAAAPAWLAIAETKTFLDEGDRDLEMMTRCLRRWPQALASSEARASMLYAVAKANDDLDHHDIAISHYAEGARLVAEARPYNARGNEVFVDEMIAGSSATFLDQWPRGLNSQRPIFVLGLPRSGTTLVEQILVSHHDVADGAEANLFKAAAIPIGGLSASAITAYAARRPNGFEDIARAYLHMLSDRFGPEGRVVDKTLNHSRYLGLIHRVLPEAKFVWLRREPGAIAWSSYRTWFAQGVPWSWSLENIAHYMRCEDRLHAHWTRTMGDAILTVPYEELVSEPLVWIPRILRHVGLDPAVDPSHVHMADRAVTTASYAQVRKPIYTGSISGWQRFQSELSPFFDAYRAS